jgi:hypothetical protein
MSNVLRVGELPCDDAIDFRSGDGFAALALRFAERFGKEAKITGEEAPTAWLNNASKAHRTFGYPHVALDRMVEWVAEWLEQGGSTLGKPTHFEEREGKF